MSCQYCHLSGDVLEALLEERDRLIGSPGPVRICFGQEDRPEPVRDVEARIERRRDVEQRIQQIERDRRLGGQRRRRLERRRCQTLGTLRVLAEVLNRANPVQIRRQRPMREDTTRPWPAATDRAFLRRWSSADSARRAASAADRHGDRARERRRPHTTIGSRERPRHLKSRREKIMAPPMSSIAM